MAEGDAITAVNIYKTIGMVIGAVLLGVLVWAITEEQTYRGLWILIGAVVGAVVGARYEILTLRIALIAVLLAIDVVLCRGIGVWIKGTHKVKDNFIITIVLPQVPGAFSGVLAGMIYRCPAWLAKTVDHFAVGATIGTAVIIMFFIVTGTPALQSVVLYVAEHFVLTIFWAAIFKTCAPIFSFQFTISKGAVLKATACVGFLFTLGLFTGYILSKQMHTN